MTTSAYLNELADLVTGGEHWRHSALCSQTDPEIFYPEKGGRTLEAKQTCMACEVRPECLQYALECDEEFGVWGGLSPQERRNLKRNLIPIAPTAADVAAATSSQVRAA